jgi:hypothetical protein
MTFDEIMKAFGGQFPDSALGLIFTAAGDETVGALRGRLAALAQDARRLRMLRRPELPDPADGDPGSAGGSLRSLLHSFDECEEELPIHARETVEAAIVLIEDQHEFIGELADAQARAGKQAAKATIMAGDRLPGGLVAVPVVPTQSMRNAGESGASFGIGKAQHDEAIVMVWDEMLRATGVKIPYPKMKDDRDAD